MTSDCRWNEHVMNMVRKANIKMWYLRRLKYFGASICTLKEVYILFIRQALEFAAPLWTSSLSKMNIQNLEKLQSYATNLILGPNKMSYEQRMDRLDLISLERRRWEITSSLENKFSKDSQFQHRFPLWKCRETRSRTKFVEPRALTRRYRLSPVPTFIRLINQKEQHKSNKS